MFRTVVYMAVLGALLRVAKSDFRCFADKIKNMDEQIQSLFEGSDERICQQSGQKEFIDSLQHAIDECSVPVTTDSMKSLIEEVCEPGSELYQTFKEKRICLYLNKGLGESVCKLRLQTRNPSLSTKQECLKLKQDFLTCTAETTGGSCGEKAVKALKRVLTASGSLTNGLCEEAASSASWNSVSRHLHWVGIAVAVVIAFL